MKRIDKSFIVILEVYLKKKYINSFKKEKMKIK